MYVPLALEADAEASGTYVTKVLAVWCSGIPDDEEETEDIN